jgi:hypothetical protein
VVIAYRHTINTKCRLYLMTIIFIGLVNMTIMAEQLQIVICVCSALLDRNDMVYLSGTNCFATC